MASGQRPFKDEPTSYRKTGIPCGNPKRYESRGVIRMARTDHPFKDQRLEAPVEDIETEGERQLQQLVRRQLETDVTIDGQLNRKKTFESSALLKPTTAEVSGTLSLENFQQLEDHDRRLEELRHCGLTQEEIELTLEAEGVGLDGRPAKRSRYGLDPTAYASKLDRIRRKIATRRETRSRPDRFADARVMSRHEMELERAISHNRDKSRLLGMLLTHVQPPSDNPDDPINHLDGLMETVRQRASGCLSETDVNPRLVGCEGPEATCAPRPEGHVSKLETLCPVCRLVVQDGIHEPIVASEADPNLCQCTGRTELLTTKERMDVNKPKRSDSPEVFEDSVELIPEDVIKKYKLSVEEIRQLPRFKDYDEGQPSKTLFLKNLTSKVTETDLVSLFKRFQKPDAPKIIFKLMKGRMRGQAFVTFSDEETATKALKLVNGYDFRGKPIIIQYGTKKNQE